MAITNNTLSAFERCQEVYLEMLRSGEEVTFESFVRKVAHDQISAQVSTVVMFFDHLIK